MILLRVAILVAGLAVPTPDGAPTPHPGYSDADRLALDALVQSVIEVPKAKPISPVVPPIRRAKPN
jgi:hypothetical protein